MAGGVGHSTSGRSIAALILAGGLLAAAMPGVALASGTRVSGVLAGAEAAARPLEPLRLVISRDEQRVDVYRGLSLIASSQVSTGKTGYETPYGIYNILEKRRHHRSNIYSGAPMPFMQRLTWSGIALHQGHVPNYPASHGCVRLPGQFARELFGMTKIGADVIITARSSGPQPISHPALFQPWRPDAAVGSHDEGAATADAPGETSLRGALGATAIKPDAASVELADTDYMIERIEAYRNRLHAPLQMLITQRTGRQRMVDIQRMLARLGHDPGPIDGLLGRNTARAIQDFQRDKELTPTGMVTDDLVAALYRAVGEVEPTGHLYVKQKRDVIFDVPVAIADTGIPLGTHIYSVGYFDEETPKAAWTALSVDDGSSDGASARSALDRVTIPDYVRTRISDLLMPGSSLIVTDSGYSRKTNWGTDFIVRR